MSIHKHYEDYKTEANKEHINFSNRKKKANVKNLP
jgi:hypothetical protein